MKSCSWLLLEIVPKRTTILPQLQKIHRPPSTIWRKMTRKTTRRHASFFNSNLRDAPPPKTSLHKVWFLSFLQNCERSDPCYNSNSNLHMQFRLFLARKFKHLKNSFGQDLPKNDVSAFFGTKIEISTIKNCRHTCAMQAIFCAKIQTLKG